MCGDDDCCRRRRYGLVNAAGAIAFVVAGAWIAPRHRVIVASGPYVSGALLAWFVLGDWYFPEGDPRAYQPSRIPLVLTLIGGAIAVGIIAAIPSRKSIFKR
jgi:hypothetical protein